MISGHIAQAVGQTEGRHFRPDAGFAKPVPIPARFAGVSRYIYECTDNACSSSGKVCPASVEVVPPRGGGKKCCVKYLNERSFFIKEIPADGLVTVHGVKEAFSWPQQAESAGSAAEPRGFLLDIRRTFDSGIFEKDHSSQPPLPYPKEYKGSMRTTWFCTKQSSAVASSFPVQEIVVSERANNYCLKMVGSRAYAQLPIPAEGVELSLNKRILSKITPGKALASSLEHRVELDWYKVSSYGSGKFCGRVSTVGAENKWEQNVEVDLTRVSFNLLDNFAPGFVFNFSCTSCGEVGVIVTPDEGVIYDSSYRVYYLKVPAQRYNSLVCEQNYAGIDVCEQLVTEGTSYIVDFHGAKLELFGRNYPVTDSEKSSG